MNSFYTFIQKTALVKLKLITYLRIPAIELIFFLMKFV